MGQKKNFTHATAAQQVAKIFLLANISGHMVYTHMVGEDSRVRIPASLFSLLASGQAVTKPFSVKGLWVVQGGQELAQLAGEYWRGGGGAERERERERESFQFGKHHHCSFPFTHLSRCCAVLPSRAFRRFGIIFP